MSCVTESVKGLSAMPSQSLSSATVLSIVIWHCGWQIFEQASVSTLLPSSQVSSKHVVPAGVWQLEKAGSKQSASDPHADPVLQPPLTGSQHRPWKQSESKLQGK